MNKKEQFVINYVKVMTGMDIISSEEALEIINSDMDEPYSSCEEVINELVQNLNNLNEFQLLLNYFILKYDKVPESEKDNLVLLGIKFMNKVSGTGLSYKTIEDWLKYINNENNTSYTSVKEALEVEYSIYVGAGLLYGTTDINLVHDGQILTIDFEKLLSGEEIVLEYDIGLENKCAFTISNAFESKTFDIEKQLNEYGFYYNTFYRMEVEPENGVFNRFLWCFFDDNTCFMYAYNEADGQQLRSFSDLGTWSISGNKFELSNTLFGDLFLGSERESLADYRLKYK